MTLDELQRLCDEATAGPWEPVTTQTRQEDYGLHLDITVAHPGQCDPGEADADFVAAARTYMPKMIAALMLIADDDGRMARIHPNHSLDFHSGAGNMSYDLAKIARAALEL